MNGSVDGTKKDPISCNFMTGCWTFSSARNINSGIRIKSNQFFAKFEKLTLNLLCNDTQHARHCFLSIMREWNKLTAVNSQRHMQTYDIIELYSYSHTYDTYMPYYYSLSILESSRKYSAMLPLVCYSIFFDSSLVSSELSNFWLKIEIFFPVIRTSIHFPGSEHIPMHAPSLGINSLGALIITIEHILIVINYGWQWRFQ